MPGSLPSSGPVGNTCRNAPKDGTEAGGNEQASCKCSQETRRDRYLALGRTGQAGRQVLRGTKNATRYWGLLGYIRMLECRGWQVDGCWDVGVWSSRCLKEAIY
jgi:hypothetical protein